jgi:hypothetical protein
MAFYCITEKYEKVVSVVCFVILLIYPSISFHTEQVVSAQDHHRLAIATVDNTNVTQIFGRGYGNNGNSFSAFSECVDGKSLSFDKGSLISFSVDLNRTAHHDKYDQYYDDNAVGKWQIEYGSSLFQQLLYQEGTITRMSLQGNPYFLFGVETRDDVCGTEYERIVIELECVDNTPIKYLNSVGDRSGSTTPPDYAKVYQFFSSEITCR